MNVTTDLKAGDTVLVKGNVFRKGHKFLSIVAEVGQWPSLWLPEGQRQWGAKVYYVSEFINPTKEEGEPDEIEGLDVSSPMLADQWSFNEATQQWELQLV